MKRRLVQTTLFGLPDPTESNRKKPNNSVLDEIDLTIDEDDSIRVVPLLFSPPVDVFHLEWVPQTEEHDAYFTWVWDKKENVKDLDKKWSRKIDIELLGRSSMISVEISTNLEPLDKLPKSSYPSVLSPFQWKSVLQKIVRRGGHEYLNQFCSELYTHPDGPADAVRRSLVIPIEDSYFPPSYPVMAWLLLALSAKYIPGPLFQSVHLSHYILSSKPRFKDHFLSGIATLRGLDPRYSPFGSNNISELIPDARMSEFRVRYLRRLFSGNKDSPRSVDRDDTYLHENKTNSEMGSGLHGGVQKTRKDELEEIYNCIRPMLNRMRPSLQRTNVMCLLARARFGGMASDVLMLTLSAFQWCLRYTAEMYSVQIGVDVVLRRSRTMFGVIGDPRSRPWSLADIKLNEDLFIKLNTLSGLIYVPIVLFLPLSQCPIFDYNDGDVCTSLLDLFASEIFRFDVEESPMRGDVNTTVGTNHSIDDSGAGEDVLDLSFESDGSSHSHSDVMNTSRVPVELPASPFIFSNKRYLSWSELGAAAPFRGQESAPIMHGVLGPPFLDTRELPAAPFNTIPLCAVDYDCTDVLIRGMATLGLRNASTVLDINTLDSFFDPTLLRRHSTAATTQSHLKTSWPSHEPPQIHKREDKKFGVAILPPQAKAHLANIVPASAVPPVQKAYILPPNKEPLENAIFEAAELIRNNIALYSGVPLVDLFMSALWDYNGGLQVRAPLSFSCFSPLSSQFVIARAFVVSELYYFIAVCEQVRPELRPPQSPDVVFSRSSPSAFTFTIDSPLKDRILNDSSLESLLPALRKMLFPMEFQFGFECFADSKMRLALALEHPERISGRAGLPPYFSSRLGGSAASDFEAKSIFGMLYCRSGLQAEVLGRQTFLRKLSAEKCPLGRLMAVLLDYFDESAYVTLKERFHAFGKGKQTNTLIPYRKGPY